MDEDGVEDTVYAVQRVFRVNHHRAYHGVILITHLAACCEQFDCGSHRGRIFDILCGDAMFYGSGAGKLPTASAVVADVVDCAKNKGRNIMMSWSEEKLNLLQIDDVKSRFFVRVSGHAAERQSEIEELFGKVEIVAVPSLSEEFAFITGEITEQEYREKAEKLDGIQSRIRERI